MADDLFRRIALLKGPGKRDGPFWIRWAICLRFDDTIGHPREYTHVPALADPIRTRMTRQLLTSGPRTLFLLPASRSFECSGRESDQGRPSQGVSIHNTWHTMPTVAAADIPR